MTKNPSRADSILWVDLKAGHTIDLVLGGVVHFNGVIDARTRDGKIIWLKSSFGERRLFHEDEGYIPELYEDIAA